MNPGGTDGRIGGIHIPTVVDRVKRHTPRTAPDAWAATALVLGEGHLGPSLLMIRRLVRDGDPWSGDMALPGGKVDPGDTSVEAAAVRETAEEVGVVLGDPVARLPDVAGNRFHRPVATVLFTLDDTPPLVPEPSEVAQAVWLPLERLTDPDSRTWHRYNGIVPFRSITVDEHMIWGLTHRILTQFFDVAGLT